MEINKIHLGDCLELMPLIADKTIDMILCDLPYGTTQNKWDTIIPFDKLWEQYERVIKPSGAIVLFGSEPFSSYLRISNIKNFKYDWIWNKILKTGHLNSKIMPMGQHETISVFGYSKINYYPIMKEGSPEHGRGDKRKKGNMDSDNYGKQSVDFIDRTGNTEKYPSSLSLVFQKPHPSKCIHPTEKPVPLFEYLIRTYTNEGETVLDNCIGSGTTAIACKNTNRNFIGMEKGQEYFDLATKRIDDHKPNLLLF
jgi:site-specific DNA-methyltransferase (adenine-specific)